MLGKLEVASQSLTLGLRVNFSDLLALHLKNVAAHGIFSQGALRELSER